MRSQSKKRGISTVEMVVIVAVLGIGVIIAVSSMTPQVNVELNNTADFVSNPAGFGNGGKGGGGGGLGDGF